MIFFNDILKTKSKKNLTKIEYVFPYTYFYIKKYREHLRYHRQILIELSRNTLILIITKLFLFFNCSFEYDPKALDGESPNLEHFSEFAEEAGIPAVSIILHSKKNFFKITVLVVEVLMHKQSLKIQTHWKLKIKSENSSSIQIF